jgi:hypothetical protein
MIHRRAEACRDQLLAWGDSLGLLTISKEAASRVETRCFFKA